LLKIRILNAVKVARFWRFGNKNLTPNLRFPFKFIAVLDFCSRIVHTCAMTYEMQAGQKLARGVARYLTSLGMVSIEEFVPTRGLRVDVFALGPKGEIWVIECKSSKADFQSDHKWHGYLEWCDRFFWAVDGDFPTELLPEDTGLIFADAYGAEIVSMAPFEKLAPARRKAMVQKFATHAARRLHRFRDPDAALAF
jgi:hypothetical protein